MSVKQLRNGRRLAGVSTPMFVLETPPWQWGPFTTCCLRKASEVEQAAPQLSFFLFKTVQSIDKKNLVWG
jgi:hypothetical protein